MKKTTAGVCLLIVLTAGSAWANNLTISNVNFDARDPANDKIVVKFDIAWENAWKSKINHDAAWLTFRLYSTTASPTNKKLCDISAAGLNPNGTSTGSNQNIELFVPADKKGAFVRPTEYGKHATLSSTGVKVTLDYSSCGFSDSDNVYASVFGIEMVFVPEGAFYAGDQGISTASLVEGNSDSDPWYISSANAFSVSSPASNGYLYVSNGNTNEDATGASFTVPAAFPKGYKAFYAMKYEVTEGQWVEFINSLPSAEARSNHDITNNLHKNTDSVVKRNTVSCSGGVLTCASSRSTLPVSYLTWMDLAAFLDWAALRPMTELEFEKMARGPLYSERGEYAWGSTLSSTVGSEAWNSRDLKSRPH